MASLLTPRQREILAFIQGYRDAHGFPPSIREIGVHFGITSTNGVNDHLQALQRKGHLHRTPYVARSAVPTGIIDKGDTGQLTFWEWANRCRRGDNPRGNLILEITLDRNFPTDAGAAGSLAYLLHKLPGEATDVLSIVGEYMQSDRAKP